MPLIQDSDKKELANIFKESLKDPVEIGFVKDNTPECMFCDHIQSLLEELKSISEKISYKVFTLSEAKKYGIKHAPTIFFLSKPNIRYLGLPSGYEFSAFVDDIIHVSRNETDIKYSTAKALTKINVPVHIMVFVTPTCPYCPTTVHMAHMFAMFKDNIVAEMIESIEYQSLAEKWEVMAVPKVVINEKVTFEGAYPEEAFVEKILEAVKNEV